LSSDLGQIVNGLGSIKIGSLSVDEPGRLVRALVGALVGNGAWVLRRSASEAGELHMLIEFERQECVEIYSSLIANGVEFGQSGHVRLTELCQRFLSQTRTVQTEIVSIDLQIQTFPMEKSRSPRGLLAC